MALGDRQTDGKESGQSACLAAGGGDDQSYFRRSHSDRDFFSVTVGPHVAAGLRQTQFAHCAARSSVYRSDPPSFSPG